ncbi:MAG: class I SAM-dependent methyltransferase [Gammaproteobacteria bacterium]|nr:class I SAM-dependent methyltransferase [Gammaproteobacteria bacterium]
MHALEDRHWWFNGRRRIVDEMVLRLPLPPQPRILDAGCGTGGNLQMLTHHGQVTGMEYDATAAAIARERGVGKVVCGSLPKNLPFANTTFNLITLLDVLEHIDDDQASLYSLSNLLAPKGYLLLTVPAFPFLWGPHDTEHHHKRRYRASSLSQCIKEAGLELQWLSYYNTSLFPAVAAVRLFRKLVPGQVVGGELALPPASINRILEGLFAAERHLLGRLPLPFGVSLIAVARKL